MKKLIVLLFLAVTLAINAQSGEKNFIDQNYIEVVGRAKIEVVPNLIYLTILLSEKDKSKQSLETIERSMKDKLKELGVDLSKDLFVKDFDSNFKSYFLSKTAVLLTKEYQLVLHDTKTLQKVFVEFQKLDISNISIEKVDHSNMEQFRKEVKLSAIKAAKEKASALSTAIDQSIGRAIYVQEMDNDDPNINPMLQREKNTMMIRGTSSLDDSNASDPGIDFEKISLNSAIFVRFELK